MHGIFPEQDMATCPHCRNEWIIVDPMTREEVEQASPEYCAKWHDPSQL